VYVGVDDAADLAENGVDGAAETRHAGHGGYRDQSRRQGVSHHILSTALDLMVVCVESGLGTDRDHSAGGQAASAGASRDRRRVHRDESGAASRQSAAPMLHNLADRTGEEDVKQLVAVLIQTDGFKTSIAQSLARPRR